MQLFVRDLTVIDFSYLCHRRGVVGESWIVDVTLDGELNDQSMVLDFGIVKKQIKFIIDEAVDHKLLLPSREKALTIHESSNNDHWFVDFESSVGGIYLQSPICAFAKIESEEINIASVKSHLTHVILEQLPDNVKGLILELRPENITGDFYHYTHGLKLHDGNCQRIAHGHRSQIEIFINDTRSHELEHEWCERWRDIYIATDEDEISFEQVQLSGEAKEISKSQGYKYFAYMAPQGRFDIAVPSSKLEVIDCDSTVELIADYIARQLKEQQPEVNVKVIAYEGVGKGAIARA